MDDYLNLFYILKDLNNFTIELNFYQLIGANSILSSGTTARPTLQIFENRIKLLPQVGTLEEVLEIPRTQIVLTKNDYDFVAFVDNKKKICTNLSTSSIQNFPYFTSVMAQTNHAGEIPVHFKKGIITSIKIYNRALIDEEVQQNYEYEQSIDRTTPTTYPMLQEEKTYGIGLANQLTEEQLKTFRLSNGKTKFVAGLRYCEGLEVAKHTYNETLNIMETKEWKQEEIEV